MERVVIRVDVEWVVYSLSEEPTPVTDEVSGSSTRP